MNKELLKGNIAIAKAAIATICPSFPSMRFSYPIHVRLTYIMKSFISKLKDPGSAITHFIPMYVYFILTSFFYSLQNLFLYIVFLVIKSLICIYKTVLV